jgi:hypothetical protein
MPKRNAAKRRRMLNGQDKKKQRKGKQSTQGIYLDAFNLAALTQQHRVKVFLARLWAITSKVTLCVRVLPGLGYPSLPPKHYREEVPQVELRPHYVKEDDFGIFVCLPEHEVA